MFDWFNQSTVFAPYITAFMLGLLGGMHCIGMCGGIIGALSFSISDEEKSKRWQILTSYNIGRISSYALIGAVAGSISYQFGGGHQLGIMRILAGALLIAMGLYLANWWQGITFLERIGSLFWKKIQPLSSYVMPVKNSGQAFLLGGLWGWLPCGLVYSALAYALAQSHPLVSMGVMAAFGLGTLPLVLASGVFADRVKYFIRKQSVRSIIGILVILFGVWTILMPMQHMSEMDHSNMEHSNMAPSTMDKGQMDHSQMDHSNH
jgi:sulfite exporter TauE/SafE